MHYSLEGLAGHKTLHNLPFAISETHQQTNSISVLLVDDDELMLDLTYRYISKNPEISVIPYIDPEKALVHYTKCPSDVIVSDYDMPVMNGVSLCKEIRAIDRQVPFVIFTGKGREEIFIEAIASGADLCLHKGTDISSQYAELIHVICSFAERKNLRDQVILNRIILSGFFDQISSPSCAFDTNGTIIGWNRWMEQFTGIRPESVVGRKIQEFALRFTGTPIQALLNNIIDPSNQQGLSDTTTNGRGGYIGCSKIMNLKGKEHLLWIRITPILDTTGNTIGVIESFINTDEIVN